ncbi:MAG: MazG family protein [Pelovirga sp.]
MSKTRQTTKPLHELSRLADIMATLRSPQGCPWDQQQSAESLKPYILEEAYELLEAIDSGNHQEICDELGDLLLQVVFLAQIYSEQERFNLADVIFAICTKMIRRHPHVFADADHEGHSRRWEQIKIRELEEKGTSRRLADRLPASLPALKRAQKLLKKTSSTQTLDVTTKRLKQGQQRLLEVIDEPGPVTKAAEEALAQQLYDMISLAGALHIDMEDLLRKKTTAKIAEIDGNKDHSTGPDVANS